MIVLNPTEDESPFRDDFPALAFRSTETPLSTSSAEKEEPFHSFVAFISAQAVKKVEELDVRFRTAEGTEFTLHGRLELAVRFTTHTINTLFPQFQKEGATVNTLESLKPAILRLLEDTADKFWKIFSSRQKQLA